MRSPTDATSPTAADLEAAGLQLRVDTLATSIDVADSPAGRRLHVRTLDGRDDVISYDALVVGTGAVPVRPPITGLTGPDTLGPDDGVHLLHSMGDTLAVARTLDRLDAGKASAVIVGAGYIGPEMAKALTARGLRVTQIEALPEVLPTVDPELGALVHAELGRHGVEVLTGTAVTAVTRSPAGTGRLCVEGQRDSEIATCEADLVLVVVGVRPDTDLAAAAGAAYLGCVPAVRTGARVRRRSKRQ